MLPPPVRDKTNLSRIVAAIVFAFAFPAMVLSQAIIWIDSGGAFTAWASTAAPAALTALPFGVMLGWPYVLCASCAWACLHQFQRHHRGLAGLIGVVTGAAVAVKLTGLHGAEKDLLWPLTVALGFLTGLGVWLIAYGGGHRSLEPKARLTLQG